MVGSVREPLTQQQVSDLLSSELDSRKRFLFEVYILTGARRNELLELRREDVVKINDTWFVSLLNEKTPRWGAPKRRLVLVNTGVAKKMLAVCSPGMRVFPYSKRTVDQWFRNAADRVGLYRYALHCLRHTFVYNLDTSSKNVQTAKLLLGYKSVGGLNAYTRSYLDAQRRFEEPPEDLI